MIKKLLLCSVASLAFLSIAKATPPLESDLRSKTVVLHSTFSVAANISTTAVLISLSSSTVWPNPTQEKGYINISNLFVNLDKLQVSSCSVKIGVVTYVDSSTGSAKYFFDILDQKNSTGTINAFYESDNSYRCLKVIPASPNSGLDGTTPYLISNDVLSGSTLIQNDVLLPALNITNGGMQSNANNGNVFPGLGDIIISIANLDASNAIGVTVDALYHYAAN